MAETVSLAVLENLVHMAREDFPVGYVVIAATIPEDVLVRQEETWLDRLASADRQRLGDLWFDLCASAALAVRSAIVPLEHNYLLNPRHPDFARIEIEAAVPFVFDERLFRLP